MIKAASLWMTLGACAALTVLGIAGVIVLFVFTRYHFTEKQQARFLKLCDRILRSKKSQRCYCLMAAACVCLILGGLDGAMRAVLLSFEGLSLMQWIEGYPVQSLLRGLCGATIFALLVFLFARYTVPMHEKISKNLRGL